MIVLLALAAPGTLAASEDHDARQVVCRMIDAAGAASRLPPGFLARVLWQESRLRSDATSRAGAQGVAQFMPTTAGERGLADPYEPGPAISQAARLLAELAARFGNLGLAAAAYNAGPARVEKWLHDGSELPAETRSYVVAVTGRSAEDWAHRAGAALVPNSGDCLALVTELARNEGAGRTIHNAPLDRALARAGRLLEELTSPQARAAQGAARAAAGLCGRVRSLGAACVVYRP